MDLCCSDIIRYIYTFIEPIYICNLKKPADAASFACTAKYQNIIRHAYNPGIYKEQCNIRILLGKKICVRHCKASPIFLIVHNISKRSIRNKDQYMHFPSKNIARFAPPLLPHVNCYRDCCDGKGWAFRILS